MHIGMAHTTAKRQVKWHPDKFAGGGDEQTREFAAELSRMANEAADVARKQAAMT